MVGAVESGVRWCWKCEAAVRVQEGLLARKESFPGELILLYSEP